MLRNLGLIGSIATINFRVFLNYDYSYTLYNEFIIQFLCVKK